VKFGTAMHIRLPNLTVDQNVKISKSKMAGDGHLKNQNKHDISYIQFDKILHGGVDLASKP